MANGKDAPLVPQEPSDNPIMPKVPMDPAQKTIPKLSAVPSEMPIPKTPEGEEGSKKKDLQLMSRATYVKEWLLKSLFFVCALVAVLGVVLIFIFMLWKATPIFTDIGFGNFIAGTSWAPTEGEYGILPLMVGSLVVTVGALLIGTPLAVGTSVFLSEIAHPKVRAFIRPTVELLAGIPSVIYGFFGMVVLRPVIGQLTGGMGFGALTAWLILAVMIVPTISTLTEDALRALPFGIREASYAMGATTWQTIWKVVLPAAKIGILDAVILGMGRAIGETMAVLMVVGNAPIFPTSIAEPLSTLTSQIALDMPYSTGDHRTALFGMAVILFLISSSLVGIVRLISRRGKVSAS